MQLLCLKERHSSCGRCWQGEMRKPYFSQSTWFVCSMSTLTRWHLLLATLWILEGIPKRLIEGVKRQQLRSTIFSYLHSRIPIEFGCDRWSTLATHLPSLCLGVLFSPSDPWHSSSAPSHRQSTFELCVLPLSLSQTTPHQNSVGD